MAAPNPIEARTATAGVVVPASADAVPFAAGRTRSAVADSSCAAAVAVVEAAADSEEVATAATSSRWALVLDVVAVAAAAVPAVVVDPLQGFRSGPDLVPDPRSCCSAAVVAVPGVDPGRACVPRRLPQWPVSRPYSGPCSVRTGRGVPSSCSGRGSHGTVAASDARDTRSGRLSAAFRRPAVAGPCAVVAEVQAVPRASPLAAAVGDEEPRAGAFRSRHCAPASSRDVVEVGAHLLRLWAKRRPICLSPGRDLVPLAEVLGAYPAAADGDA